MSLSESCGEYPVHPVAAIFPIMAEDELQRLADDMTLNGLREPIVLMRDESIDPDQWLVADGRNRYRACLKAGVEPRFTTNHLLDAASIGPWIVSHNLYRRHLTTSQRSAVAVEYEKIYAESARERQGTRTDLLNEASGNMVVNLPPCSGKARDEAAELFNVSGKSVSDAKFVAKNDPVVFQDVLEGRATVSGAAKAIRSKPDPKPLNTLVQRHVKSIMKRGDQYARALHAELSEKLNDNQISSAH